MAAFAKIVALEYYLPTSVVTNEALARIFTEWSAEKIFQKTGIKERHIAAVDETAADMAFAAADKLINLNDIDRNSVDFIIFCTQAPDYFLPTSACVLQDRLRLPTTCGALDINLGCSGYVYGLALAKGLIESGIRKNVLLLTGDTYSKFINDHDRSVRTLFGDGASATLVAAVASATSKIGSFVMGTDGAGARNLIVPAGGARQVCSPSTAVEHKDASGNIRSENNLFMDGAEVMKFTLSSIPSAMEQVLRTNNRKLEDIDHVIFHQANSFMLEALRKKTRVPEDKFVVEMDTVGNTVSSTIPIAIVRAKQAGRIKPGDTALLLGFGVGYSWSGVTTELF